MCEGRNSASLPRLADLHLVARSSQLDGGSADEDEDEDAELRALARHRASRAEAAAAGAHDGAYGELFTAWWPPVYTCRRAFPSARCLSACSFSLDRLYRTWRA